MSKPQLLKMPLFLFRCIKLLGRSIEENFITIEISQSLKTARTFAEKTDQPENGPAKKEELKIKMPGFVNPENRKEEGYFTQKAKKQLEELKRKINTQQSLTNPEKKES